MVKRARKAKKAASPKRKRAKVKKTSKKTGGLSTKKEVALNRKAHWSAYKDLQKKIDKAWDNLRSNVKRKAASKILLHDRNQLLLLLGECNYMARECMRYTSKKKRH